MCVKCPLIYGLAKMRMGKMYQECSYNGPSTEPLVKPNDYIVCSECYDPFKRVHAPQI